VRALDVGIIGCGTAGPAAALFLSRAGHAVTVYERVEAPKPIGAGIILQPTGQAVLARLGLADEVIRRGARLDKLRVDRHDNVRLLELSYAHVDAAHFGVGLHRGVLFQVLFGAVRREGIPLRLGVSCERLDLDRGKYFVVDTDGTRWGPHDMIVIADGARSRLRDEVGTSRRADPYPWGALWFIAKDPEQVFSGELYQMVRGTRRMLGLLPTGLGPIEGKEDDDVPEVSLYWSIAGSQVEHFRKHGFADWKDEILRMAPHAEFVLDAIEGPHDVLFSAYHDVVMSPWHTRGIVTLGDAGHAMSPQLGQGANLALWDAMILADAIEAEGADIVRSLDRYSRERRDHLGYYQWVTRALTPFFQSDHDILGTLRDLAMPLLNKIHFFNRAMVLGMCGTADGHPWKQLALPKDQSPAGQATSGAIGE
jgi:2-polyprenyl-6-methoxyphenol hydroxylase-like FAD-dependent oxidoreductase